MEFQLDLMRPFCQRKSRERFVYLYRSYLFSIYGGSISVGKRKGGDKISILCHSNLSVQQLSAAGFAGMKG